MFDWNNDGKQDWRDDAFYNNGIAPEDKSCGSSQSGGSNHNNSSNNNHYTSSKGWAWFIILCIVYFIIKLLA